MLMFTGEPVDTAATAQPMLFPGVDGAPVGVASELELALPSWRIDECVDVGSWI